MHVCLQCLSGRSPIIKFLSSSGDKADLVAIQTQLDRCVQALQEELQLNMLEGMNELLTSQEGTYGAVEELKSMILAKLVETDVEV